MDRGEPNPEGPRRSIPVHAGHTPGLGGLLRPWPVPPRACGAHQRLADPVNAGYTP